MGDSSRARLLLLLPTSTYRAAAFVAAADALGIDLTVASEQDSAFSVDEPDKLLTLDFTDPGESAARILAFHQSHPLNAVFGIDDQTAVVAAHAAQRLGLHHNPVRAVEAAGDKFRQRVLLDGAGVPVPRFQRIDIDDVGEPEVDFPSVLKPISLSASRGVIRVDDKGQLSGGLIRLRGILDEAASPKPHAVLIEDFIPGMEYALEGMLSEGHLRVLALFDKPDPLDGPYFAETIYVTPSRAPAQVRQALHDCAQDACRALGLQQGPVHVELRYNGRGPWLIELAARPIGGRCGQVLRFGPQGAMSLETALLGQAMGRWMTAPARESAAAGVMMIPVPRAGTFREVRGVREALATPRVTDIAITINPGAKVRPLPDEARYLGFIFARAPDPATVENVLRAAWAGLEIVIDGSSTESGSPVPGTTSLY